MKEFPEIFDEMLASDQLGAYQSFPLGISGALGDDPTIIWHHLRFNPWLAMAVYDDMIEKDGAIFSNLETRREGVLSKPWRIKPTSDKRRDRKVAEFIEETIIDYFGRSDSLDSADEFGFSDFLSEALESVARGVSIGEIIFAEKGDRVYVKEIKFKPQQLFAFGESALASYSTQSMMYPQTGRLRLRAGVMTHAFEMGAELPEYKFFVMSNRPRFGNRWGDPLLRKVYWQSWIKRNSIKTWLKYQEKGAGVVIAKYNDGAADAEQQEAVNVATAINEESAVAIAKKFLVEVHEVVRNIGSSHKELVDDFSNAEIARTILGQTLTSRGSDGGGSRSLGEVHERVQANKIEADSVALMSAVNKRIVRPLTVFNFGPDAVPPKFEIEYEPKEDQDSRAKRYTVISGMGLELSKRQVRSDFQIDEPRDDDDRLGGTNGAGVVNEAVADGKAGTLSLDFTEKKTSKLDGRSSNKLNSKTARFKRLRPSMIEFSED